MKHIKIFENDSNKLGFVKDFLGVKIWPKDSETLKMVTKLSKEHKMFLLASHSGVKYYVTDSQSDLDSFKKAVALL